MSFSAGLGDRIRERASDGVMWGSIALAALALLITLQQFFEGLWYAIQRPNFALMYTGGIVARLASHPEWLYHPLDQAPFLPTIYPPLYPSLLFAIQQATSLPIPLLTRFVGFVSVVISASLLYYIVDVELEHQIAAIVAGGLYLLSPALSRSTVLARVDHLGMVFGLLAIAVIVSNKIKYGEWFAAAVLTLLALYTKQSLIVFPIAICLIYAAQRKWHDAGLYLWVTGGLGLSFLAMLAVVTEGRAIHHLFTLNAVQPYSTGRLVGQLVWLGWTHLTLLAIALYVVGSEVGRDLPTAFWALPLAGAVVAIPTMGKLGSWIGYAYPLIAGACLCMGWLVAEYVPRSTRDWSGASAAGVAMLALVVGSQLALYAAWAPNPGTDIDAQRQAAAHIADADGPVLSEDPRLDSEPFGLFVLSKAAERGVWMDKVAPRIRDGEYEYIVLWQQIEGSNAMDGRWNREQIEAIRNTYRHAATYGKYRIYEPVGDIHE